MADRKMTLRDRARAWWIANGRSFDEALPPGEQGYLAGWHARGRADKRTAIQWQKIHRALCADIARLNLLLDLERAKEKK